MGLHTLWATVAQSLCPTRSEFCLFHPVEGADHTQAIVLGCVGGIVAVGLGLVLAYRLSVEIYDRREYNRFEKERQQPNWKQVRLPPSPLGWFSLAFLGGLGPLPQLSHSSPALTPPPQAPPSSPRCVACLQALRSG